MDYFVERMRELGGASEGVELSTWMKWLAMDMSGDLSWNEKMHEMRDSKLLCPLLSLPPTLTLVVVE